MQNTSENVDQNEIGKFNQLAHRWWDHEGEFRPLHDINPLRLQFIEQHAELSSTTSVLDVGCGGGILSESMAARGAHVSGIDLGEATINVARQHAAESGYDINYSCISAETLAARQAESFDIVTCMEMLEHVPDPAAIIKACADLAKPGGHVFFSTLNRNPKSFLYAILGAEYLLHLLPRGTHDYGSFIRPSELSASARQAGLETADIKGITYHPIMRSYNLTANVDVNYLMYARKP